MPAISCSAPGKIILCGEHAVVYGTPAIAVPVFQVSSTTRVFANPSNPESGVWISAPAIQLETSLSTLSPLHPLAATARLVIEKLNIHSIPACRIKVSSTIPTSAGLGSSASVSVSFVRALSTFLGHPLDDEMVNQIAFEIEKIHHKSPSGIDNTVVTFQHPVYFQIGKKVQILKVAQPFTIVIADSGLKSSTGDVVSGVRERWLSSKTFYDSCFDEIGKITNQIRETLEYGRIEHIGSYLVKNHELLKQIGVSIPALDHLVEVAMLNGALGAKLSGSGGGGNMIALVNEDTSESVSEALKSSGAVNTIITHIS